MWVSGVPWWGGGHKVGSWAPWWGGGHYVGSWGIMVGWGVLVGSWGTMVGALTQRALFSHRLRSRGQAVTQRAGTQPCP